MPNPPFIDYSGQKFNSQKMVSQEYWNKIAKIAKEMPENYFCPIWE